MPLRLSGSRAGLFLPHEARRPMGPRPCGSSHDRRRVAGENEMNPLTGEKIMADKNGQSTTDPAAGTTPPLEPLTPEEAIRQFRALMERVPFPQAPPAHRPFRRRLAHVDPKFVDASINAVGASPEAQAALNRSDEELRAEVDFIARWSAFGDEMTGGLRTVLAANDIRRQRLGLIALQGYRICEQLARDEGNEKLMSFVREMKRMKKFGRVRRRRPGTPPEETLTTCRPPPRWLKPHGWACGGAPTPQRERS